MTALRSRRQGRHGSGREELRVSHECQYAVRNCIVNSDIGVDIRQVATGAAAMTLGAYVLYRIAAGPLTSAFAESVQPGAQFHPPFQKQNVRPTPDTAAALTPAGEVRPACAAPRISLVPMHAGRAELVVDSECRRFQTMRIRYAGMELCATSKKMEAGLHSRLNRPETPCLSILFAWQSDLQKLAALDLDKVTNWR